jgi:hypothetical protein
MEEQLKEWLGDGWVFETEKVAVSNWRKPKWRAEFLCQRALLDNFHVHDEPAKSDKRKVWFGIYTG